jgi:hypothetical protein
MSSPYQYRVAYIAKPDCVEIEALQFDSRASYIRIDREAWPNIVQAAAEILTEERVADEVARIVNASKEPSDG